jgi:4-amino-4-deoxy-L-arabinose transferase-like glycosyltransferase
MLLAESVQISGPAAALIIAVLLAGLAVVAALGVAVAAFAAAAVRVARHRPPRPHRCAGWAVTAAIGTGFGVFALWPAGVLVPVAIGVAWGLCDDGRPPADARRSAEGDVEPGGGDGT